ncbi:MAG: single-stranded DNA-binding protein, partial [Verrucomicrobiota bacterium]
EGRLQLDQWESPQGEKRSRLRVRAERVQFLGSKDAPSSPSPAPHRQTTPPTDTPRPDFNDSDAEDEIPF